MRCATFSSFNHFLRSFRTESYSQEFPIIQVTVLQNITLHYQDAAEIFTEISLSHWCCRTFPPSRANLQCYRSSQSYCTTTEQCPSVHLPSEARDRSIRHMRRHFTGVSAHSRKIRCPQPGRRLPVPEFCKVYRILRVSWFVLSIPGFWASLLVWGS